MNTLERCRIWAVRILTMLAILAFVPGGIMKVVHHPTVVEGFQRTGIPESAILPLGIVELFCLVLYLIPRTTVLGALLLTGYLGGATLANIVNRSDFIHALAVGLLVWAAAWLRIAELRTLIPIRRTKKAPGTEEYCPDVQQVGDGDAASGPHLAPTR